MLKRKLISSIPAASALLLLMVPGPSAAEPRPEPSLRVATTLPPLAWLISRVAGPDIEVTHLVNPGELPETFQPSDRQITHIARASLFFRVGIPMENGPWLAALEDSSHLRIVDLRRGVELRAMERHHHLDDSDHSHGSGAHGAQSHGAQSQGTHSHSAHSHGAKDPHIWLSPRRLEVMAWIISRSLSTLNPADAEGYAQRAGRLTMELRSLDEELKKRLAPIQGRSFFVFHPSWGYFADDFGLHQVSMELEGKEPTERELTHLVRSAKIHGMRTIFVQPQIRSSAPQILAETVDAQVEALDPLAPDVPSNLRHVADRLLASLRTSAPGP